MVTNCLSLGSLAKSAIWRRLFSGNWCRCGRCPACVTEKIDCRMTLIVMDKLSFTWTDQFCRYLSRVTTPRLMGREETLWTISVINTLCVETCLCSNFVLDHYLILLYLLSKHLCSTVEDKISSCTLLFYFNLNKSVYFCNYKKITATYHCESISAIDYTLRIRLFP